MNGNYSLGFWILGFVLVVLVVVVVVVGVVVFVAVVVGSCAWCHPLIFPSHSRVRSRVCLSSASMSTSRICTVTLPVSQEFNGSFATLG